MAAAGFGEATLQFAVGAIEEQGFDIMAMTFAQRLDPPDNGSGVEAAGARVDAQRQRAFVLARITGGQGGVEQPVEQDEGRLSTTSQPISSSVLSAVVLPAPDRPDSKRMDLGCESVM